MLCLQWLKTFDCSRPQICRSRDDMLIICPLLTFSIFAGQLCLGPLWNFMIIVQSVYDGQIGEDM
ncbi:hypothetical protein BDV19DRAFT_369505 [Aspergillus venezuelensis]